VERAFIVILYSIPAASASALRLAGKIQLSKAGESDKTVFSLTAHSTILYFPFSSVGK